MYYNDCIKMKDLNGLMTERVARSLYICTLITSTILVMTQYTCQTIKFINPKSHSSL